MKKYLLILAGLLLTISGFAANDFNSEDFLKVLKEKRNLLKDYQLKPYVVGGVKYESKYVSSEGAGFYLQVQNQEEAERKAKERKVDDKPKGPEYTELWGPYKTMVEAEAARASVPKDSIYKVLDIANLKGAYSTKWYTLQESLHKDDDRELTGCYAQQAKEFEKAKADDGIGGFIRYLGLEKIKIQIFDLRKGVPRENPLRDPFGFGDFTVSATLDAENNCKITRVADLKELFKSHIEHHKKLLTANVANIDSEKRESRRKVLSEFQDRLKLQIDMIRNPENFRVEPKAPPAKKTTRTKV